MSDEEKKIREIYKKIEREKNIINAARAMRAQTTNEAVQSRLDTQLRDGQRNLKFFEDTLRDVQMRKGMEGMTVGEDGRPPAPPPKDPSAAWASSSGGPGQGQYGQMGDPTSPQGGYAAPAAGGMPKTRPNFTKLGELQCMVR